ncbi:cytochrome c6 [Leptolyngbya sp. Heron Island J]|uniref:cytochrome c6 PetJ n=1 Tax=Leptolyngbya sp. Heron Island J TaxID=1385935 RepID=UPI0003B9A91B|nr:c-type cytochrome [Leptolyngbya sp. Heron Island J]ESA36236.1 cytochrome c6 [Leptolyngbya sp. Heron Island J]
MKSILATVTAFVASALFLVASPAMAADAGAGAQVFSANCAACHIGGGNAVNPAKTLKKDDLVAYGKDTSEAIVYQVNNGNGGMPGFGGRLTPEQIENVAAYVLSQADKGW